MRSLRHIQRPLMSCLTGNSRLLGLQGTDQADGLGSGPENSTLLCYHLYQLAARSWSKKPAVFFRGSRKLTSGRHRIACGTSKEWRLPSLARHLAYVMPFLAFSVCRDMSAVIKLKPSLCFLKICSCSFLSTQPSLRL